MERTISEAAGRLNGAYGEVAWTPIRYVNRVYSRSVLAGLYRSARARDGMNLVARNTSLRRIRMIPESSSYRALREPQRN